MKTRNRRKVLGSIGRGLAVVALAPLGGCGFTPLYGENDEGETVADKLATVQVAPLRDRFGQQMHNLLRDRLNPNGQPNSPDFRLEVRVTETIRESGIRQDETATRASLKLDANFYLRKTADGEQVLAGLSTTTTSFDIVDQPFASTTSEKDARERALHEVADDIRTRIAVFFRTS